MTDTLRTARAKQAAQAHEMPMKPRINHTAWVAARKATEAAQEAADAARDRMDTKAHHDALERLTAAVHAQMAMEARDG